MCTRHDRQNVSPEQLSLLDSSLLKQWPMRRQLTDNRVSRDNYSDDDGDARLKGRGLQAEKTSPPLLILLFCFARILQWVQGLTRDTIFHSSLYRWIEKLENNFVVYAAVDVFYSFRVFFFFLFRTSFVVLELLYFILRIHVVDHLFSQFSEFLRISRLRQFRDVMWIVKW